MQRSGNHAVIDWLRRNISPDDTFFLNNCSKGDPMLNFASAEAKGELFLFRVRKKPGHPKYPRLLQSRETMANHIVSYENRPPCLIAPTGREPIAGYDQGITWANVLIYRSFLNWLASYYKLKLERHPQPRKHIKTEALGLYADHLEDLARLEPQALVPIFYDQWATDSAYRSRCLEALEIPLSDNATGEITKRFGGGSSFGENDQAGEDIARSKRWAPLAKEAGFLDVLEAAMADVRLAPLLESHFPEDSATARKLLA